MCQLYMDKVNIHDTNQQSLYSVTKSSGPYINDENKIGYGLFWCRNSMTPKFSTASIYKCYTTVMIVLQNSQHNRQHRCSLRTNYAYRLKTFNYIVVGSALVYFQKSQSAEYLLTKQRMVRFTRRPNANKYASKFTESLRLRRNCLRLGTSLEVVVVEAQINFVIHSTRHRANPNIQSASL